MRLALAVTLVALTLAGPAWASVASREVALELVREARALEREQREDLATRRYLEALALDHACGEAYLGLGELRARTGDLDEALRVYDVALEALPSLGAALGGRARVRRAQGQRDLGRRDLAAWADAGGGEGALRELAGWYGEDGFAAAQLATWRRLLVALRARGDADLGAIREAETMVRALTIVVGPADAVTAPPHLDPVRRGLARMARRAG